MKLNVFHLKVVALVFMLIEHVGRYLPDLFPKWYPLYFEYAGRVVAPIFFFLAVESLFKTSNRRRYITRLYIWAIGMQVGNILLSLLVKSTLNPDYFYFVGQNIFLSIAVGVSMIAAMDWARKQTGKKKLGWFAVAFLLAFGSLFTEASYNGLLIFIIFYIFYNKKPALYYAYAGLSVLFLVYGLLTNPEYFWVFEFQWMMISALPLIMLYNGERGSHSLKYLFYGIYPLHIWVLYTLSYVLEF